MTSVSSNRLSVSIVVAVKNGSRTLRRCLESIRLQTYPCELVVMIDSGTTDDTAEIAAQYTNHVLVVAASLQERRNYGAEILPSDIIGFIDADMILEPDVVLDAVLAIENGAGAVVIPERSFGESYWARVRAYERSFYFEIPSPSVESPRFFVSSVFFTIGCFDSRLDSAEDTAINVSLSHNDIVIGRTSSWINHDEGPLTYRNACKKKGLYAVGIAQVTAIHGMGALLAFVTNRPWIRRPSLLLRQPCYGIGLLALKGGETISVLFQLLLRGGLRRALRSLRPSK